jgi:RNA polymerase sigma-70 factor (ECF subfamily)
MWCMRESLDHSWFDLIFNRYQLLIFRRCFALLGNPEDAEDVTEDTFLRAFNNLAFPSMSPDHQRNWLFRTAINRCLDYLRRPTIVMPASDNSWEEARSSPIDLAPTPEDLAMHAEVRQLLEFLSKDERDAVMARAYGCTFKEIAAVLDCSIGAAFNHVESAMTKLKRLYGKLDDQ